MMGLYKNEKAKKLKIQNTTRPKLQTQVIAIKNEETIKYKNVQDKVKISQYLLTRNKVNIICS